MKIYLIRHGQTPGNALGRYIGRTDEPLSKEGLAKAQLLTPDTSVKTVFVTPLRRTQQTAHVLFPNAEQTIVPDLREMDFGAFENRSAAEMEKDADYRAWVDSGCTAPCPGGEGMAGFAARVGRCFYKLVQNAAAEGRETVYIVAHGGTLMAVLSLFAEDKQPYYSYGADNLTGWEATARFEGDTLILTELMRFRP